MGGSDVEVCGPDCGFGDGAFARGISDEVGVREDCVAGVESREGDVRGLLALLVFSEDDEPRSPRRSA